MSHDFPETWDEPSADFERFVSETVRHRIGKYVQPDHPNRVSKEAAENLLRKIMREVGHAVHAGCYSTYISVSVCMFQAGGSKECDSKDTAYIQLPLSI